ncbi:MAG: RNA polymerase sporulation sigma factor SigH [Christensenellales bacterium]
MDHIDTDLTTLEDETLVDRAQKGDEPALMLLLNRHKTTVRIKARRYFLIGADYEDLVQEGMIGLYKAIRDYRPDRQASFRAFADLCIKRQIISAIKTATRQKHIPLNSYVSLNKPVYDDENERTLLDMIEGTVADPEELYINQEDTQHMENELDNLLSSFERQVLSAFLDGKSYQEIAASLDRHTKAVDNALQRIKKKMLKYMEANRL